MIDEKKVYEHIGLKIKELRDKENFSQEVLAEKIKVSRASIANYESGKQSIYISDLYKIADEFSVDITELLPSIEIVKEPTLEEALGKFSKLSESEKSELIEWIKKQK